MNKTYACREGRHDDPLYCIFEAEPYVSEPTPIRQLVININADNTADGLRPIFFFYNGPDARKTQSSDGSGELVLKPEYAQPVILNLNADFKGVLFMPEIPVIINGNGHKFEGFIIAKEYRTLATTYDKDGKKTIEGTTNTGVQVKYSTRGETDNVDYGYNRAKIYVDPSTGNVCYKKVTDAPDSLTMGDDAHKALFGLHKDSKFKKFKADAGVTYQYVYYDYKDNPVMDERPFHNFFDKGNDFIEPLDEYSKDAWSNIKIYGRSPNDNKIYEIPKVISSNSDKDRVNKLTSGNIGSINAAKGIVLLDKSQRPIPIYADKEGTKPIYFCKDYVDLTGSYNILTLDRVEDSTRDITKEFLLTKEEKDTNNKIKIITDTTKWQ